MSRARAAPVGRPTPVPGDGLLHPLVVTAVALLALNDHWGKAAVPGWVTGKLSDVAGLAFFPLLLQAGWEVARRARPSTRALAGAVAATALVFTLVKVWPPAAALYRCGLGLLQWPVHALVAWAGERPLPGHRHVALAMDATDLLALPALALAWRWGLRRCTPDPAPCDAPGARISPAACSR